MTNFLKGCLFILLLQCFLVVHVFQQQSFVEQDVSVSKFSGDDTDPTNDVPDETPEGDGNAPYFVKNWFGLELRFKAIPYLDDPHFYYSRFLPVFTIPPSRH